MSGERENPQLSARSAEALRTAATHLEIGKYSGVVASAHCFAARRLDSNQRLVLRVFPRSNSNVARDEAKWHAILEQLKAIDHPAWATVLGGGLFDEYAFVEMEHFRALPLVSRISQRALSPRQRVELLRLIADAVRRLNSQRISCRDLLPGGVLVGRKPGTLRIVAKLSRPEAIDAFHGSGADQRAFSELIKVVAQGGAQDASLVALADLANECAAASADIPPFTDIVRRLEQVSQDQLDIQRTSIHYRAEAGPVDRQPKETLASRLALTYRIKLFGSFAAFMIAGALLALMINRLSGTRSTAQTQSSPKVGSTSQPRSNQLPRSNQPPRSNQQPPSIRQPWSLSRQPGVEEQGTSHRLMFMPDHSRSSGPLRRERLGGFPPRQGAGRTNARPPATDQFQLSDVRWRSDGGHIPVLTAKFAGSLRDPGDRLPAPRVVWVIERQDGESLTAQLVDRPDGRGSLHGRAPFLDTARGPLQTYLAVEPDDPFEPLQRVSNTVEILAPETR